jgi:predicted O-methyltransferase YrrM
MYSASGTGVRVAKGAKPPWIPFRRLFQSRPFADQILCHFLRRRLTLPELMLSSLFDEFDQQPVTVRHIPRGNWSTPMQDVVMLLKIAVCTNPAKLMEIGSFRGYTALYLAQHVSPESRIVTVDSYPDHGEAYRNKPEAAYIDRRIGEIGPALFAKDEPASFDLIFIDADHTYDGVRRDTEVALPLLSPCGFCLWHDYANWGYFTGANGVPEYLEELSSCLPIAHVSGSSLAIHCPSWGIEGHPSRARYLNSIHEASMPDPATNPWDTDELR